MPDFKDLHSKWKTAKKEAKTTWEMLDRMTADASSAHTEMKFAVARFPGFTKGLGPALDNLQALTTKKDVKEKDLARHKQDIKKQKEVATAAIKQYDTDIKALVKSRAGVKVPTKTPQNTKNVELLEKVVVAVDRDVKKLGEVLGDIDKAVKTIKD